MHELFKYMDDDREPRSVDSSDVHTGQDFSAKEFCTGQAPSALYKK